MSYHKPQRHPVINWQEALAILEETDAKGVPRPFSVTFCTADESRQTGGEIITYERAVWHVAGGRVKAKPDIPEPAARSGRRPNHQKNFTRNIRAFDSDQIRKLHVHLILEINNLIVR